jgi:hypothetical protein
MGCGFARFSSALGIYPWIHPWDFTLFCLFHEFFTKGSKNNRRSFRTKSGIILKIRKSAVKDF